MGTQLGVFHQVDAPALVPYSYGLFSVAEPRVLADPHWRLGVEWVSENCADGKVTTGACIDSEVAALTPDDYCDTASFEPFTAYAYNNQSLIGRTLEQHRDDAISRLIAGEQRAVEERFWTDITTAAGAATDLTGWSASYAFAWLEQELAEQYGGTGVIHMNRAAATMLYDKFRYVGGRLVSPLGTSVVAGGGYDEQGSTAPGTAILIGTGPVVIYRGEVDTRQSAVNRPANEVSIVAQRDYVLGWDCVAIGVDITLDTETVPSS